MDLNNIKIKVDVGKSLRTTCAFLKDKDRWIMFLIFVGVLGYCGLLWHKFVYRPQWSEGKKQEYLKTKGTGEKFNEENFNQVLSELENRKIEFSKESGPAKDIFRLK